MVHVVSGFGVALGPEFLNEDVRTPALKCAGAFGEAGNDGVRRFQGCFFRFANGVVVVFDAIGPDGGRFPVWFAASSISQRQRAG